MPDYDEIVLALDACSTVEELVSWADWLRASEVLNADGMTEVGHRGPIAPWSIPDSALHLASNGLDDLYRLSSGELAKWCYSKRNWAPAKSHWEK